MSQTITVVYEKGVFKPLENVSFHEQEKLKLTVQQSKSLVETTCGMIKTSPKFAKQVAEEDTFSTLDA